PRLRYRARRPGRTAEQLRELLDQRLVVVLLAEAAAAGHDDRRLLQLRAVALLPVARDELAVRAPTRVHVRRRHDRGRAGTAGLGDEGLGPDRDQVGLGAVELRVDERVAAEDRVADLQRLAVDGDARGV